LVLIDQHAAHERVAFERLMKSWREGQPEVQNFLIPISMDLDESLVEALILQKDYLAKAGIEIERGGPAQILVSSCPAILKESAVVDVLERLAKDVLSHGESFKFEAKIADVFASMACHSVIRAGQLLERSEMEALLQQMDEFSLSSFCPHGRPVFVEYPFRELEKDFGRLV
jgi:DNA mismatch repair protein MutL